MTEHVDVLIVGAGLSGIDAGYHLQANLPGSSYAILEASGSDGGTWDLFRYPGVRSDSDMYTLGYSLSPVARRQFDRRRLVDPGYVRETARTYGIDRKIRFHHRVIRAQWSTADAAWTVDVERTDTGEQPRMTCGFLFMCTGYYRYDEGYTAAVPGDRTLRRRDRASAVLVRGRRPRRQADRGDRQRRDRDHDGAGARQRGRARDDAAAVAQLRPGAAEVDPLLAPVKRFLGARAAYGFTRWKNVFVDDPDLPAQSAPAEGDEEAVPQAAREQLPAGYDIDAHFTPTYEPWDQRLCLVPDGDLFRVDPGRQRVDRDGPDHDVRRDRDRARVRYAPRRRPGRHRHRPEPARDRRVELDVDGEPVTIRDRMVYKGMMLNGVPNFAFAFGYTNASWTLKADLTCKYVAASSSTCTPAVTASGRPSTATSSVTSLRSSI